MSIDYSVSRSYTYNGNFPEELSHNWKSPDGVWLNLRDMTDEELAEIGWFPVEIVEYDYKTHTSYWNSESKSFDIIELPEPISPPADYKNFWDLLLQSPIYVKLKAESKTSVEINALCTEFLILLSDAKSGNENKEAIQNSINEILAANIFVSEELTELKSIFQLSNFDSHYVI